VLGVKPEYAKPMKLCEGCGEALTGPGRADRRHHNAACRKMAFRRRRRERDAPALAEPAPAQPLDREAVLAEALAEPRLVVHVAAAARTNRRAAAWLLEHRHNERRGVGAREPDLAVPPGGDPFVEVDELAARRRLHPRP
jgi:hypothetical protein